MIDDHLSYTADVAALRLRAPFALQSAHASINSRDQSPRVERLTRSLVLDSNARSFHEHSARSASANKAQ